MDTTTSTDRCDRCGAGAKVCALLPSAGVLFFCGHHARVHEDRLRSLDAQLVAARPASGR